MVDIEADGPIPGDYSMISLGAVVVEPSLSKRFYVQLRPISERWIPEYFDVGGFSRTETLTFEQPEIAMQQFADWIQSNSIEKPIFIADNNGFDWQFINWYFHHFCDSNPFGHSSSNLGSLYKGIVKDTSVNFKHLRKTHHSHNALEDALGNAEALLTLKEEFGLKIKLV
jgi:DNA polymerase III epsilon subunit-like protein